MDLVLEMDVESGSSDGFLGNASGFNDDSHEEGLDDSELMNCVVQNVFVMRHVVLEKGKALLFERKIAWTLVGLQNLREILR